MTSPDAAPRFDAWLVQRAAVTGILLQLSLAVAAHYVPWIRSAIGEYFYLMFAGLVGLFYGRDFGQGYLKGALGGAIAGGTCGLIGIAAANILRDVTLFAVPAGTVITAATGAVGGMFGQWSAVLRKPKR